jgi:hypothetical protein
MKRARLPLSILLILAGTLLFSSQARAGNNPGLGIFGDVHVGKDEVRHDDVVCIGGHATIEGKVEGDVVVIGGKLDYSGEAQDVVAVFTRGNIQAGSVVHGDMVQVLGMIAKDPGTRIEGQNVDIGSRLPPRMQRFLSRGLLGLLVLLRVIGLIVSAIVVMLIALLIPERIERMSGELDERWPASIGFGLLGFVVVVILAIGLAITIIGIPFAILLGLLAKLLGLAGITAILLTLGKRIGAEVGMIGEDSSILAPVMLGFALTAVIRFIPVFGELIWTVLGIIGLGLVVVTRLGRASPEAAAS